MMTELTAVNLCCVFNRSPSSQADAFSGVLLETLFIQR